LIILNISY